jgi:hypothetical protein
LRTIIQLLLAALVVHGCVRMGGAVWRNYQFKDAIEQEARFAGAAATADLHARILELAEEYDVVLEAEDVVVERQGQNTSVSVAYVESIPLIPRLYTREHLFEFQSRVRVLTVEKIR